MKKIVTIIFLGIYLFNLVGYQVLVSFFENAIAVNMITQLDKGNYSDAELIELKIPYPLPYAANWPEYQRFDGEADINGTHYNYVKRKMYNDTLYLLCILNHEKTKLTAAKNEYVKNTIEAANTATGKKNNNSLQKAFGTDHNNLIAEYTLSAPVIDADIRYYFSPSSLLTVCTSPPFQPPGL